MIDLCSSFKFHLESKFRIQLFSHFPKNGLESEGMVQEKNEFPYFGKFFPDSMHILNRPSNISKDSGAFQLHADTFFDFVTFVFKKICAI